MPLPPRFILTPEQLRQRLVSFSQEDAHHCRVLRLQPGDALLLSDGQGREYSARLASLGTTAATAEILLETNRRPESPVSITLFQGFARAAKLEWVIEKATELGVARVIPVVTAHSQMKLGETAGHRLVRWQEIARQAVRQSGRTRLPMIGEPMSFADSLAAMPESATRIMFYENQGEASPWPSGAGQQPCPESVGLWVGPEGGFAAAEAALAQTRGFQVVSLGPRILRSETAGIAAVCLAQFCWGDLSGNRS